MRAPIKWIKAVRNNPKKSIFGALASGFIGKWLIGVHDNHLTRHAICQDIKHQSLQPIHFLQKPKKVTVFLNPAASDGKATRLFKKNAEPVLHLSGWDVNVVRLDYEGQAKKLMAVLEETDMIVAAGGDGTVNEIITGLLRRPDAARWASTPIGVIPLGRTNSVCHLLCSRGDSTRQAKWIVQATSDLFKAAPRLVDVMKVESEDKKNTFALTDIRWGSYSDAQAKQNKYWYFGSLRKYATYFFMSFRTEARTPNSLNLSYNGPVAVKEASTDVAQPVSSLLLPRRVNPQFTTISMSKFMSWLWPSKSSVKVEGSNDLEAKEQTASQQIPEDDKFDESELPIETIEFMASANLHDPKKPRKAASATISIEDSNFNVQDFITNGPKHVISGRHKPINCVKAIESGKFLIAPNNEIGSWFCIDNEKFEAMTCTVELLPNRLLMVSSNLQQT